MVLKIVIGVIAGCIILFWMMGGSTPKWGASTLVFGESDLHRLWEWEIQSGHWTSWRPGKATIQFFHRRKVAKRSFIQSINYQTRREIRHCPLQQLPANPNMMVMLRAVDGNGIISIQMILQKYLIKSLAKRSIHISIWVHSHIDHLPAVLWTSTSLTNIVARPVDTISGIAWNI